MFCWMFRSLSPVSWRNIPWTTPLYLLNCPDAHKISTELHQDSGVKDLIQLLHNCWTALTPTKNPQYCIRAQRMHIYPLPLSFVTGGIKTTTKHYKSHTCTRMKHSSAMQWMRTYTHKHTCTHTHTHTQCIHTHTHTHTDADLHSAVDKDISLQTQVEPGQRGDSFQHSQLCCKLFVEQSRIPVHLLVPHLPHRETTNLMVLGHLMVNLQNC